MMTTSTAFSFAAWCCLFLAASFTGTTLAFHSIATSTTRSTNTALFAYIPDGFTAESYKKFKEDELKKKAKLRGSLAGVGPKGFQSRSMQSFQEAMERGEASHLMPVFNSKERLAKGELRPEDVPYMQRGGKWDNTDIKGAKNKKKWLSSDKSYAAGGYQREQSVSILGFGSGLDWTGKNAKTGPGSEGVLGAAPKFGKNYRAPNVKSLKQTTTTSTKEEEKDQKKRGGFFGMF